MAISRRIALKQAFIVAGGAIFLPACLQHKDKSTLALHNIRLDPDQQETLETLADILLPGGSTSDRTPSPSDRTLSATAVGAHLFALRMIDDCYPVNQQQQFLRGLTAFDEQARHLYGKPFTGCDPNQQAALVATIDAATTAPNASPAADLSFFFRENKNLVIRGYLGSKYFLTKIEVYELVPGRWHGCTPVIKKS